MKNKKTFYIFILREKEDDDSFNIDGIYPHEIYAYTDNAEYAYAFLETRNMDMFNYRVKKLNKKDIKKITDEYMLQNIVESNINMKSDKYKNIPIKVHITEQEQNMLNVQSTLITHENIFQYTWTDDTLFKNKYRQALTRLMYIGNRRFLSGGGIAYEIAQHKMRPNFMNILLDLYGELFK